MLQILSLLIVVVVSAILGMISYYNNPKSATNRMVGFFSITMIAWAITMYATLHPPEENLRLLLIRLSMLAAIAMSTAVLFLSHTIPSMKFKLSLKKTSALLIMAFLGMTTAMSPYMFTHLEMQGGNIEPVAGPGMLMFLITGLGYSISGIFILLKKYRLSVGIQKQQLLFVLIGITLMHILLITANFVIVLLFKSSFFISFGPFFTLPFLISVFYAITRHKFLEIRLVVIRAISLTLLIGIAAALYAGALYSFADFIPESNKHNFNFILTVILALSLHSIKKIIEKGTEKLFFRTNYESSQLLEELGVITTSTLTLSSITSRILKKLTNTLQIDKAAFLLIEENGVKVTQINYESPPLISKNDIRTLAQKARSNPFTYEEATSSTIKQAFQTCEASVILPLENTDRIFGIMCLGQKKSGHIYSNQDIDMLNIFIPQISVAIQNSLAYEKIKSFNQTLEDKIEVATQKIRSANKNLRHLDKLKDEFVYLATHELKNPVTAMKGYLSMIEEGSFGKIPKNLEGPLFELSQSNQQLVNLVNDLLQIARAEAHTVKMNTIPVNICEIVEGVINSIKPLAQQKKIPIRYMCNKDKILVLTDPERLKEVFNNLLSNAIKYSQKGVITINYLEEGDQIITHVRDEGVGIAEKDQQKIFSRFFRAEEEVAKGIPGSGLGLFIVRQLVEKMGGKIWFTSKLNKGSTFSFSLPKA